MSSLQGWGGMGRGWPKAGAPPFALVCSGTQESPRLCTTPPTLQLPPPRRPLAPVQE